MRKRLTPLPENVYWERGTRPAWTGKGQQQPWAVWQVIDGRHRLLARDESLAVAKQQARTKLNL